MKFSKLFLLMALPLWVAIFGCASKAKTQAQIRRAYAAGEQAAHAQMEQAQQAQAQQAAQQPGSQEVRILGRVKNSVLPWSDGLTLARALVEAEYQSQNTPTSIIIFRNSQPLTIDPKRLLDGEDFPLFPGDSVIIQN
jgi:hypothetical protein